MPLPDEHPSLLQPGEELPLRTRPGRRRAYFPAQGHSGGLIPPAPERLLRLGAAGLLRSGAIRGGRGSQPQPPLSVPTGLPHPEEVIPGPHSSAMRPGQHRHNVNVIRSVPDRDPPHAGLVIVDREAGPVHDLGCDTAPLFVGQHPVPRRGPD